MLTRHFLLQSAQQLGVEPKRISEAALDLLATFQFPGNVRQLENICHWLTVMAPAQVIEPKDLPPEVGFTSNTPNSANSFNATTAPQNQEAYLHAAAGDDRGLTDTLAANRPEAPLAALTTMTSAYPQISADGWELGLEAAAVALLATDRQDVWEELTRRFESRLISAALAATRGRRIEAAQKLGIGRNTITRKIQELGLE